MTKSESVEKLKLKNVNSAEEDKESFVYECKIDNQQFHCELDTAASDIFLSLSAAQKLNLPITDFKQDVVLGDGSSVSTVGTTSAKIKIGMVESVEKIYIISGEDNGILTLGRSWGTKHQPSLNWKDFSITTTRENGQKVRILPKTVMNQNRVSIKRMSFKKMARELKKGKTELFMARMTKVSPEPDSHNTESMEKVKANAFFKDLISEYADVFRQELPDKLPPKRAFEFEIVTDPSQSPATRPVIRLSWEEQKELKRQLADLLKKGLIRHSTSPYGAPVFFVKKKGGALRMVCDYRGLNKMTRKDSNPLPLLEETLDQLAEAKIFSKFDLVGAYHQLRIREEDIHKSAIRTRFGTFEWRVVCFGLTNAPAAFTRLASDIFKELNGDCLAFYLDDVIIYSRTLEEHKKHLRSFLNLLRKHKLLAKGSKCEVGQEEVYFLGQYVSAGKIRMDDTLVQAVKDWPTPKSVKDIQKFLGLSGYYRKFIRHYADIARPISDLVRKHRFKWNEEQRIAFEELKKALVTAPVLAIPKIGSPFTVTTDASKFAVGATLEQEGHPVAFLSHRLTEAENNWHTGDQELLAFLIALQKWDVYLRGVSFQLNTDHEPIRYLQTKPRLSPRQQRWLDIFQQYDFNISHLKGKENIAADALSRRVDLESKRLLRTAPKFLEKILQAQKKDAFTAEMVQKINNPELKCDTTVEKAFRNFGLENGFLIWKGSANSRIFVPNTKNLRKEIIQTFHEKAHFGSTKVYAEVARHVYWNKMFEDIQRAVACCKICQANKIERRKKSGLMIPHNVPKKCWEHITADFVTEFPESTLGSDSVLVVVDKLSKRVVLIPMKKNNTAEEVAHLFELHVFSKFGVPEKLTSDRDPKFTSSYWKSIMNANTIKLNMATTDHPETDGQSERSIQTVISVLRPVIQTEPQEWEHFLPSMEYEINAAKQESTKLSPFEIDIGRIPKRPLSRNLEIGSGSSTAAEFIEKQKIFEQVARDHLTAAKEAQKYYADKSRQDRQFEKGDWVMLQATGTNASTRAELPEKWQPRFMGPVEVLEKIGEVSYRLELPPSMKRAHNIFHVSRLKPYSAEKATTNIDVVVDPDGTIEQVVEKIIRHVGKKKNREYLVQFSGEQKSQLWMKQPDLKNAKELVLEYENGLRGKRGRGRPPKEKASVTN